MRRLMLLRHAKAERPEPGARDFDRALAPAGREAAPRVGAYMASHALTPDLTVCSPARRAKETWDLAAAKFPKLPRTIYERHVYELHADGLLDLARKTAADVQVLLMVGHNPALEDLAELMVASGERASRERLAEKFPTGALAVIDFSGDAWDKLQAHSGRLDRLVTPKTIAGGAD